MSAGPAGGGSGRLQRPLGELVETVDGEWAPLLRAWRDSAAGNRLIEHIDARARDGVVVYPADPFRALRLTAMSGVRVLILGQDPYHGSGQAEGLAFSVAPGQRLPPSLRNIFGELQRDLGLPVPATGSLLPWARQGVLLLNSLLSVEDGRPASHSGLGWEALTDSIISALARDPRPKVFMLWGAHAQSKAGLVQAAGAPHLVLQCNHPSPLSARRGPQPFFGCAHFSRANAFLAQAGRQASAVDWRLDQDGGPGAIEGRGSAEIERSVV